MTSSAQKELEQRLSMLFEKLDDSLQELEMTNSKQKGNRGERAACELLRSFGYQAERTVQYCGNSEDSADIKHNIQGVRLEVKLGYNDTEITHKLVNEWLDKLDSEKSAEEVGLILWKKDRGGWTALFRSGTLIVHSPNVKEAIGQIQENKK